MTQIFVPPKGHRQIRLFCVLLALAHAAAQVGYLRAEAATALPTLTSARVAHGLTDNEASKRLPIRLQAVVTYYDPSPDPKHSLLFVTDSSASIYVNLAATPSTPIHTGDLVEVIGNSGPGQYAPVVVNARVQRISASELPAAAPRATMAKMLAGKVDAQWVEIEGVVHAVHADGRHIYLDLALQDGDIMAMTVRANQADYRSLVDATVVIRGNEGAVFNDQRKLTGAHLLFPGIEALRVVEPAPSAPFDQPVQSVAALLHFSPSAGFRHRVHVRGTVTLQWPNHLLCIDDLGRGLCAHIDQTETAERGDRVDLIGFPALGPFTPTLLRATFKPQNVQRGPLPPPGYPRCPD
jgi:hypothetical protein